MEAEPRAKRIKLFAGIALEEGVQRKLAAIAERLRARGLVARFESAEKYHLTLAFLGWVDAAQVDALAAALKSAAAQHRPFALRFDRIGAFPHERKPRIVWIGAHQQPATYRELANSVHLSYGALGFAFKDDPVAHVTVARIKETRAPLPTLSSFAPIAVDVRALTLFESLPAGRTTRYEVRATAALNAA
ncbi:MAG: RNA 2',3'-cyclic phosphodiesterase [Candidatus Eremiobacteraeota bacterium]|nr:RNA 2',3'-cyclic phosphodiesterase [Candidatus Eremiobacteraeota bacterium]